MTEYIEREAALREIERRETFMVGDKYISVDSMKMFIKNRPAADVAPVVHGQWEYIPQTLNTLSQLRCPFCRWWSLDPSIDGVYNYCPHCGAKMDGGDTG